MIANVKNLIIIVIVAFVLSGCTSNEIIKSKDGSVHLAERGNGIFNREPSDRDLFREALFYLSNTPEEPNYREAKVRLEKLIKQFPESRWAEGAGALVSCLNRIDDLQGQVKQEKIKYQNEHIKLTKENEGLKNSARLIEEKYSAEMIRLQQENEQLKKDIQQLKNLEIQLDKREKMLR